MEIVRLRFGDLSFRLRPEVNIGRLEKRLVAAVKRGAGIVRLPMLDGGEIDAMVTPAVAIAVERHHVTVEDEPGGDQEPALPWLDLDLPDAE